MKCFPYTLKDRAKNWYMSLPANSLTTWDQVCERFMLKYYPNKKTQEIRSKVMNFAQEAGEPFHEAWERFQELLQQCPHHQMAKEMLWQFFYDGLTENFQFMVDSTAGGNIADKSADELKEIFDTLAASSLQKSSRAQKVDVEVVDASPDIKKQIADLMREIQELRMSEATPAPQPEIEQEPCGVCGEVGHPAEYCPRMAEMTYGGGADCYAAQGFLPQHFAPRYPIQQQPFYPPPQPYYPQYQPFYQPPPPQVYNPQTYSGAVNSMSQQCYQTPPPAPQLPFPSPLLQFQAPPPTNVTDELALFMQLTRMRFEAQEATTRRIENQLGQISGAVNQFIQEHKTRNIPGRGLQLHQLNTMRVPRNGKTVGNKVEGTSHGGRTVPPSACWAPASNKQNTAPSGGWASLSARWARLSGRRATPSGRWAPPASSSHPPAPVGSTPAGRLPHPAPAGHRDVKFRGFKPVADPPRLHKASNPYIPPIPILSRPGNKTAEEIDSKNSARADTIPSLPQEMGPRDPVKPKDREEEVKREDKKEEDHRNTHSSSPTQPLQILRALGLNLMFGREKAAKDNGVAQKAVENSTPISEPPI